MITKPTIICDGCSQPITIEQPAGIIFLPIRGGLFLNQNITGDGDKVETIEHRIINSVHLHNVKCFEDYTGKIVTDARAAAKTAPKS